VKPLVTLQPVLNFGVLVRGIVVDDQMKIQFWRRFRISLLQELNPFLVSMSGPTLSALVEWMVCSLNRTRFVWMGSNRELSCARAARAFAFLLCFSMVPRENLARLPPV
jgi:hypothetical protein